MIIRRGIHRLAGPALGALLTLVALYLLQCWSPGPRPPAYTDVQVDSVTIVAGEPDADAGLLEGLVRPRAEPTVRATARGAAAGDVASFCLAAGYALPDPDRSAPGFAPPGPAGGDPAGDALPYPYPETAGPPPPTATSAPAAAPRWPPSGLPPALLPRPPAIALGARSGTVGRRQSEFWLPTSSGDLVRETFAVRPPFQFRVDGDSLVVRGSRFWWVRALAPVALCAGGAGFSLQLDSPLPAAAGCALGAVIAIR